MLISFDNYADKLSLLGIHDSIALSSFLLQNIGILTVAGQYFNYTGLSLRFSFIDFNHDDASGTNVNIDKMLKGIGLLADFLKSL